MERLLICMVGSIRPRWETALESLRTIINSFSYVDIQIVTNNRAEIYPQWDFTTGRDMKQDVDYYRFNKTFSPHIREECKIINNKIASDKVYIPDCMKRPIDVEINESYIESIINNSNFNFKNIQIKLIDNLHHDANARGRLSSMAHKFSLVEVSNKYDLVLRIRPDYIYTIPKFKPDIYKDPKKIYVSQLSHGELFNKDLPVNWMNDGVAMGSPDMMRIYFKLESHINNEKRIPLGNIHYFMFDYLHSSLIQLSESINLKVRHTDFFIDNYYLDRILPMFLGRLRSFLV